MASGRPVACLGGGAAGLAPHATLLSHEILWCQGMETVAAEARERQLTRRFAHHLAEVACLRWCDVGLVRVARLVELCERILRWLRCAELDVGDARVLRVH